MFDFFTKLIFSLKKPKLIIVAGNNYETAAEAIYIILSQHFKVKKCQNIGLKSVLGSEVLILPFTFFEKSARGGTAQNLNFFIKKSRLLVLAITHIGEIPSNKDFFAGEKKQLKEIVELSKTLPARSYLILNFDDETVREIDDFTNLHTLTFGFQKNADFRASDILLNGGTNFKINHKGNIIPFWLEKVFGKEQIYAALVAASAGIIFGLNLVQISQALKNYQGIRGRMKLLKGIKNSWILDNSNGATVYSTTEALEILSRINPWGLDLKKRGLNGRKIAVLGDILEIGKYSVEAHESLGEKAAACVDLLFTVGQRAKFIAKSALDKGIPKENIFQFDKTAEAGLALQKKMKKGDLILITGSKEMEMEKIVEEVKA